MIRTFADTGALIWWTRSGTDARQQAAAAIFDDEARVFLASPFLRAELLPYALRTGALSEIATLQRYFAVAEEFTDLRNILRTAEAVLGHRPLGLVDALHVAAAYLLRADEFITTESGRKSSRSAALFDNSFVRVTTLRPRR